MTATRSEIARSAAAALAAMSAPPRAVVGFDGFIDAIIEVVDQRHDMSPGGYTPLHTISAFASRCAAAAGKSANLELVVRERRFGGNGPLLASGLARAGAGVVYVGAVGRGEGPGVLPLDPIYAPFASRCEHVIPVAPPAATDALEFADGKLMLGQPANVQRVTWPALIAAMGLDELRRVILSADLLGIVNWTMMAGVEGIWRGLMDDVLANASRDRKPRWAFIDLADPAKRSDDDVRRAVTVLADLDRHVPVALGLNLSEAQRLAAVLGAGPEPTAPLPTRVLWLTDQVHQRSGLSAVAVHPREGAAAAIGRGADVRSAWFDGPFTRTPRLSTGAGDHFNAGFALALTLGLNVEQCLAVGCGCSGAYVRDADSPTRQRLVAFLNDLPPGEPAS